MLPATYNLDLYRGDTGRWQFRLWTDSAKTKPADLAGVSAEAMVRDKAPGGAISISMTVTVTEPNIIDMELTAQQSRDLPAKGIWDLQLTYPSGDIATPLKGAVNVTQDVTFVEAAGVRRFGTVR
jgi:hypothetical protein